VTDAETEVLVGVAVAERGVEVVVAAATVVAVVDVCGGFVEVEAKTPVVEVTAIGTVMLGSGRPAIAAPAIAPTAITARASDQDLRMRPAKLPAAPSAEVLVPDAK
jgi:hypothetical protein